MDFEWEVIRHYVDTYEDMQHMRKAENSRARMFLRRKLLELGYLVEEKKAEDEEDEESWSDKEIDAAIQRAKDENKLSAQELEMIDDNTDYAKKFKALENRIMARAEQPVKSHRIWTEYLSHIKGVNTLTAARLICMLGDCSKFATISKLWAYAGYSVQEGCAQRRHKGEKSNWNRRLKTLGYLMADVFMKHRTLYRTLVYDVERAKLREMHPEKVKTEEKWDGIHKTRWNDGHIHAMALRKTAKIFFANYWLFVRRMYGLETRSPYAMEKLAHTTLMQPEKFFERDVDA